MQNGDKKGPEEKAERREDTTEEETDQKGVKGIEEELSRSY